MVHKWLPKSLSSYRNTSQLSAKSIVTLEDLDSAHYSIQNHPSQSQCCIRTRTFCRLTKPSFFCRDASYIHFRILPPRVICMNVLVISIVGLAKKLIPSQSWMEESFGKFTKNVSATSFQADLYWYCSRERTKCIAVVSNSGTDLVCACYLSLHLFPYFLRYSVVIVRFFHFSDDRDLYQRAS